ncbi:hypothetical protein GALMADRAFT_252602 [Galerina marginata CBS 339.88]|uniref:Snurportin-1 n=1 Tax=Galerina marginata (strain CBS 339.88) TaxID=685588 RepID=A0A067SNK3_GALM3|nr:hypothetical protein GALMADRAFT_252602 [Galerina marginata CBS 339.88]
MFTARKSSYKLPPTTIRDKLVSQEARRNKALEEQKRRRAQKIDSTRQLDLFAGLTLGASDDEENDHPLGAPASTIQEADLDAEDEDHQPRITPASVAQYAAMLVPGHPEYSFDASTSMGTNGTGSHPSSPTRSINFVAASTSEHISEVEPIPADETHPSTSASGKSKKKNKRGGGQKRRAQTNKPSKWADNCMYAELLEMRDDEPWDYRCRREDEVYDDAYVDGLPRDLESGWVAVAPVPVGKRCLAVTHQSAGVAGVVPNTTLRSRLLGKSLLARFPSPLPPLTVLDCILDANWRENGILHVLDVVRWKGQDVAECEAGFRFWWRDTRLAELTPSHPPPSLNASHSSSSKPPSSSCPPNPYTFPYPTTFLPVPYHTNTTLAALDGEVIPAARTWRDVNVSLPMTVPQTASGGTGGSDGNVRGMDIEPPLQPLPLRTFAFSSSVPTTLAPRPPPQTAQARVAPEGLLLYVAEASYEPGTSPLSSWVPICGYDVDDEAHAPDGRSPTSGHANGAAGAVGPLDLFQRLVRRRMARQLTSTSTARIGFCGSSVGEVTMEEGDEAMEMD